MDKEELAFQGVAVAVDDKELTHVQRRGGSTCTRERACYGPRSGLDIWTKGPGQLWKSGGGGGGGTSKKEK